MSKVFQFLILVLVFSPGAFLSCTSSPKKTEVAIKEETLSEEEQRLKRLVPWPDAKSLTSSLPYSWQPTYSADAKRLRLIGSDDLKDPQAEVHELDLETNQATRMTFQSGAAADPYFVPPTGALFYRSNVDELKERPQLFEALSPSPKTALELPELPPLGAGELYYREDREAVPKRLTNHAGFDGFATVHPDGNTFIYSSIRGGKLDLYQGQIQGESESKPLITGPENSVFPIYSRDGEQILWINISADPVESVFMTANHTGSQPSKLQTFEGVASYPSWHPQVEYIVFSGKAAKQETFAIYGLNLNGNCISELFRSQAQLTHPVFSPDGAHLLITVEHLEEPQIREIYQVPVERELPSCPQAAEEATGSREPQSVEWGGDPNMNELKAL